MIPHGEPLHYSMVSGCNLTCDQLSLLSLYYSHLQCGIYICEVSVKLKQSYLHCMMKTIKQTIPVFTYSTECNFLR